MEGGGGSVSGPIVVMQRYELKYIVTAQQRAFFERELEGHMQVDRYGETPIASLYYDTPDFRLIRTSIEKPAFKEKLRLRSYGLADDTSPVFLEMKRKAYGVVYKRRVQTTIPLVKRFFDGDADICAEGQINTELTYFRDLYKDLAPACMVIYDRTAFFEPGGDLRLTMDRDPRYRMEDLDLRISMDGTPLLDEGCSILEIKVQQAMPLWLTDILSRGRIYKTGFSKYGEAYKEQVMSRKDRFYV